MPGGELDPDSPRGTPMRQWYWAFPTYDAFKDTRPLTCASRPPEKVDPALFEAPLPENAP